jgi:chromosome condensin MukBEF MukE localization factor
LEKA